MPEPVNDIETPAFGNYRAFCVVAWLSGGLIQTALGSGLGFGGPRHAATQPRSRSIPLS